MPDVVKRVEFELSSRDSEQRHQATPSRHRKMNMPGLLFELLEETVNSFSGALGAGTIQDVIDRRMIEFKYNRTKMTGDCTVIEMVAVSNKFCVETVQRVLQAIVSGIGMYDDDFADGDIPAEEQVECKCYYLGLTSERCYQGMCILQSSHAQHSLSTCSSKEHTND